MAGKTVLTEHFENMFIY